MGIVIAWAVAQNALNGNITQGFTQRCYIIHIYMLYVICGLTNDTSCVMRTCCSVGAAMLQRCGRYRPESFSRVNEHVTIHQMVWASPELTSASGKRAPWAQSAAAVFGSAFGVVCMHAHMRQCYNLSVIRDSPLLG